MKVYTKTGDKGITSLYDGSRRSKSDMHFEVLGSMDELSSRIGILVALTNKQIPMLRKIQRTLQDFNSHIATIKKVGKRLPIFEINLVTELEEAIDEMEKINPKLTKFIIPGVNQDDAQAHMCRTQARATERSLLRLLGEYKSREEKLTQINQKRELDGIPLIEITTFTIPKVVLCYMNRLSDYFFVLARWLCTTKGIEDCFV
jgi:cob(I)alamin adenosyltransferase